MANTSDIRNGLCIEHNNDIWIITEFQHVKPARGGAFVRTKLKSLSNGKVVDNTFIGSAKIKDVRVERRKYQYLYGDDNGLNFMDNETYDQISIQPEMIENSQLLKEGMDAEILFHAEKNLPLTCELPQFVVLEVTYTEPGVRGDTATNVQKPATLETGAKINVPIFVETGTKIKIDTRKNCYVERVK